MTPQTRHTPPETAQLLTAAMKPRRRNGILKSLNMLDHYWELTWIACQVKLPKKRARKK